jgi:preprotein translocase subunit SecG
MQNVLLTIHLIACIALVIAVMLQRSEGGALGMGGGGTGGLISGRGAAGVLVRTTMILAGVFFVTSIIMTRLNNDTSSQPSLLERQAGETTDPFDTLNTQPAAPAPDALNGGATTAPAAPTGAEPAPAVTATPDPLAPKATPPAATPAAPAPATPAPTTTTPAPENGGSPTP